MTLSLSSLLTRLSLSALLALPLLAPEAQERTASTNQSQEATWNALKTVINLAGTKADAAKTEAEAALTTATRMEACGKEGKIYAPGSSGADPVTGCRNRITLSSCQNRAGYFGVHVYCGAGQIVTKVCSAGRDPDCIAQAGTLMTKGSYTRDGFVGPSSEYTLTSPAKVFTVLTCCTIQ